MEENILFLSSMVMGVTALLGNSGLSSRFKPVFALLFSIGLGLLMFGFNVDALITGIVSALSAMGVWSGTAKTVKG